MTGSGERELWQKAVSYAARKHEGARRKADAVQTMNLPPPRNHESHTLGKENVP